MPRFGGSSPPMERGTFIVLPLDVAVLITRSHFEHLVTKNMLSMNIVKMMSIHLGEVMMKVIEPIVSVKHQGHRQ